MMLRPEWAGALEEIGCTFVSDAPQGEYETNVEIWRTAGGQQFFVPYIRDGGGKRIAKFQLDRILRQVGQGLGIG